MDQHSISLISYQLFFILVLKIGKNNEKLQMKRGYFWGCSQRLAFCLHPSAQIEYFCSNMNLSHFWIFLQIICSYCDTFLNLFMFIYTAFWEVTSLLCNCDSSIPTSLHKEVEGYMGSDNLQLACVQPPTSLQMSFSIWSSWSKWSSWSRWSCLSSSSWLP